MGSYAQNTYWDPTLGKRVARTTAPAVTTPTVTPTQTVTPAATTQAPAQAPANDYQSVRDYAAGKGVNVDYKDGTYNFSSQTDPALKMAWSGQNLNGMTLDPNKQTNFVTDTKAFDTALSGLYNKTPAAPVQTQQPQQTMDFDAMYSKLWDNVQSIANQAKYSDMESTGYDSDAYQSALADIKAASDPLHQQKLKDIKLAQDEAELALRSQMAGQGALDSSEMNTQMAKLKGNYLDQDVALDAEYENNMAQMANAILQSNLSRKSSSESSYNSMIGNLAQMYMNGSLDLTKFVMDDAYRQAALGQDATNNYLNYFGTIAG